MKIEHFQKINKNIGREDIEKIKLTAQVK